MTRSFTATAERKYTSWAYVEFFIKLGVRQSMGAVGTSAENALAESSNGTLKREFLHGAATWTDELSCHRAAVRQHVLTLVWTGSVLSPSSFAARVWSPSSSP